MNTSPICFSLLFKTKNVLKRFSSTNSNPNLDQRSSLDPYWIVGFADGEASFSLSIYKHKYYKLGWCVLPSFVITLHNKDLDLLLRIKLFFGVGNIKTNKTNGKVYYHVSSLKDLIGVIIPFCDKYPLLTQKRADFLLFKSVVELMIKKEHLTPEGLIKIVGIKASMNLGLSDELNKAFPNYTQVDRPLVKLTKMPDPAWLAGFTCAEGSFICVLSNSKTNAYRTYVQLRFTLTQHDRDLNLMNSLIKFLDCGNILKPQNLNYVQYNVTNFADIFEKIIPFFDKYPLQGTKGLDYNDFCIIANLIKDKSHLTTSGLELIREIKSKLYSVRIVEESTNLNPTTEHKSNIIYMYNRDKSILYYSILDVKEFLVKLNIQVNTFNKHLEKGTYYLGKYLFSREYSSAAKLKNMSISELALMLNKDRVKFKQKRN